MRSYGLPVRIALQNAAEIGGINKALESSCTIVAMSSEAKVVSRGESKESKETKKKASTCRKTVPLLDSPTDTAMAVHPAMLINVGDLLPASLS